MSTESEQRMRENMFLRDLSCKSPSLDSVHAHFDMGVCLRTCVSVHPSVHYRKCSNYDV